MFLETKWITLLEDVKNWNDIKLFFRKKKYNTPKTKFLVALNMGCNMLFSVITQHQLEFNFNFIIYFLPNNNYSNSIEREIIVLPKIIK